MLFTWAGTPDVSSQGVVNCPNDYVIIPGGTFTYNNEDREADRFCGLGFPDAVTCKF